MKQELSTSQSTTKRVKNSELIPPTPLPFQEVMADVFKVKPPQKPKAHQEGGLGTDGC